MNKLFFLALALVMVSCQSPRKQAKDISITFGPKPNIIYKTKADYSQYVPVLLSLDGQELLSYPAPQDLYYQGRLAVPSSLADGYWLDHRGIGPGVAFLDLTYEAYAKLDRPPSPEAIMGMLLDRNPLLACYDCGSITEVEKLDILIRGQALSKCKDLLATE